MSHSPESVASAAIEYTRFEPTIDKQIAFRPASFASDVALLHQWMQQPHVVPFWNLAIPFSDYQAHLQRFLADTHQKLHIGLLDGDAMSYWETYWVKDDIVGQAYDAHPADQGIHLLIGPPSFLGKGYALPLLKTMTHRLFAHPETEKVIAEPDIRNEKMIHIFCKCGYQATKEIDLPDKTAILMVCQRDSFVRSWNDVKTKHHHIPSL